MKKVIFIIIILFIFTGCTSKKSKELASQVYETEENREFNRKKKIKEITSQIKKLEDELDETLEKYQKVGNFHRSLGVKMMHYRMYLKAYEHFDKAIEFYPNSEMLHYYRGVAAGQFALSQIQDHVKRDYLNRSKLSHEYSIQLNPRFAKGLYALSILYVYEFDMPEAAKKLLDRLLDISTREFDAMLLRALLFEKDDKLNDALDLYDRVLTLSKKENHLLIADTNRDKVLKRITGE